MGAIAEDILDGTCCALCGQYFMTDKNRSLLGTDNQSKAVLFTHGYPVVCAECYTEDCGYQPAEVETI